MVGKGIITFDLTPTLKMSGLSVSQRSKAFLVDKYPACPNDWMRSEGITSSYFVPVEEGKGMWLDFNKIETPFHIAAVVSIQGINVVTGLPCNDAQLEQYKEKCPKHDIAFGHDRFCSKCNHKWPKQNYISTTGTPNSAFWLDGFRAAEGAVRQYILTAEKMRGVASNIIGKDRVFAIGISFFLSKEKRPDTHTFMIGGDIIYKQCCEPNVYPKSDLDFSLPYTSTTVWDYSENTTDSLITKGMQKKRLCFTSSSLSSDVPKGTMCFVSNGLNSPISEAGAAASSGDNTKSRGLTKGGGVRIAKKCFSEPSSSTVRSVNISQKLEVGAGAKISQIVHDDPNGLDYWHDKPEAILCINYCLEVDCRKILEAGEIDLEGSKEAFLEGIPVGNK